MGTLSLPGHSDGPVDHDVPRAHDRRTLPRWNFIARICRRAHSYPFPSATSHQFPRGRTKAILKVATGGYGRVDPEWAHLRVSFMHLIQTGR